MGGFLVKLFIATTILFLLQPQTASRAQDESAAVEQVEISKAIETGTCNTISKPDIRKTCWLYSRSFDCGTLQLASESSECSICQLAPSFCLDGYQAPGEIRAYVPPNNPQPDGIRPDMLGPLSGPGIEYHS